MVASVLTSGCVKPVEDEDSASSGKYLYVASGTCYAGSGITTFTTATSSNQIFRLDLSSGQRESVADYFGSPSNTGDSPVALVNDGDNLLVAIENTTNGLRRVERVKKTDGQTRSTYTNNAAALSAVLRSMVRLDDGYLLISKSSAVEKHGPGTTRLVVGANPWMNLNTPASSCTTSTTLIPEVLQLNNGLLAFAHASSGNARVGIVSATGYAASGDCKAAVNSPSPTTSFPSAMVYDRVNNIMLVAYSGANTNADVNTIQAYSVTEGAGTASFGSANEIYDSNGFGSTYNHLLFGVSAMVLDLDTNILYVAHPITTATTTVNFQIDRYAYDASKVGSDNTHVLTHLDTFYPYGVDTKCISSMIIAN